MRVISVVGARPQFVKLAPVAKAARSAGIDHATVHSGQHYDHGMSQVLFEELGIGEPEWNLEVGSGSHGVQTGAMLAKLDELFAREQPDWVLVYGDTNSTLAGTLAAVKLHLRVAHLEAGLRSFNRAMPEEHNRVLTDHAADLLLAPTDIAAGHLADEGLADRTRVVGDVMVDVLLDVARRPDDDPLLAGRLPTSPYVLATIHRAENTDDPTRLASVIDALASIDAPVVLPRHPRLRDRCAAAGISLEGGNLNPIEPLSHAEMVWAIQESVAVATDSEDCRRRRSSSAARSRPFGPRPSGSRRSRAAGTFSCRGWRTSAPRCFARPDLARGTPYGAGDAAERSLAALAVLRPSRDRRPQPQERAGARTCSATSTTRTPSAMVTTSERRPRTASRNASCSTRKGSGLG